MAGYGTNEQFATWLTDNGHTLPVSASSPDVLRQRGSAYIDGLYSGVAGSRTGIRFMGTPTEGYLQERAWPRTGVIVGNQAIPSDAIPLAVIYASFEAALAEANNPGSLSVSSTASQRVTRERVEGAVDVQYADPGSDTALDATPVFSAVYGLLKPFLINDDRVSLGLWSVGC
jgi:hypothetical protein